MTLVLCSVDIFPRRCCNKLKRKEKKKFMVHTPHSNASFTHQKEHESCAFIAPNRPIAHNKQSEARIFEYLPGMCIIHCRRRFNGHRNVWIHGSFMQIPAMHSVQAAAPAALHLPLVFRKGRDALAKERRFLDKNKDRIKTKIYTNLSQLVQVGAPTSEVVPFSHNSQSVLPVASWYLPAAHDLQNVAFVFFGWYLPAEHNLHAESPGSSEKRPSEHFVHFIEAIPEYFPAELVVKEN